MWCVKAQRRWRKYDVSRFLPEALKPTRLTHLVGLGARGAAWLATDETRSMQWQQTEWDSYSSGFNPEAALKSVIDLIGISPKHHIGWILAPSLARSWIQTPPLQTASLAELHAVAQARANQLFGRASSRIASTQWAVTGDWHASQSFLCAAMPSVWSLPLQSVIKRDKRCSIYSSLTLALARFKAQLPNNGWLALAIAGELNIMHWAEGRMTRLRSTHLPIDSTAASAEALAVTEWQREMLRAQNNSPYLHWLCLLPNANAVSPASNLSAIQPIEWTPSERVPIPQRPGNIVESGEEQVAPLEAMHAAWSAQQLIAGIRS